MSVVEEFEIWPSSKADLRGSASFGPALPNDALPYLRAKQAFEHALSNGGANDVIRDMACHVRRDTMSHNGHGKPCPYDALF